MFDAAKGHSSLSHVQLGGPHGDGTNNPAEEIDLEQYIELSQSQIAIPVNIDPHREVATLIEDLPITPVLPEILNTIIENPITILQGTTGSGKSTMVPKALVEYGFRVVVTQPRILAARSLATWVAHLMGEELGQSVGYRTAHERFPKRDAPLTYVTDGLQLVRELFQHAHRRDILVLDEVHEWNLQMEVLAAWAKMRQAQGADFKIVVMSATIDAERLSRYFWNAPVISVPGRLFEVHELEVDENETVESSTIRLLAQGKNVLVFQPGKREIEETIYRLRASGVDAELIPLHAEMSALEQSACFRKYDRPKCVVATDVAQTSLTIGDIHTVVDSGLKRMVRVVDGVETMVTEPISIADRLQRKGRAGRVMHGEYIDLCPVPLRIRPRFSEPAIECAPLEQTVLRLKSIGYEMDDLKFFHSVDKLRIVEAKERLRSLGLTDHLGQITDAGRRVSHFPTSAQSGRILLEAERQGVAAYIAGIVAVLEVRGIAKHGSETWRRFSGGETESDLIAQYIAFQTAKRYPQETLSALGFNVRNFNRALEIERDLVPALNVDPLTEPKTTFNRDEKIAILKSICAGLIENIYLVRDKRCFDSHTHDEREIGKTSVVRDQGYIVGVPFDLDIEFPGREPRRFVRWATRFLPEWLGEIAPDLRRELINELRDGWRKDYRRAKRKDEYYNRGTRETRNRARRTA